MTSLSSQNTSLLIRFFIILTITFGARLRKHVSNYWQKKNNLIIETDISKLLSRAYVDMYACIYFMEDDTKL